MIFRIITWLLFIVGGGFLGFYFDNKYFEIIKNDIVFHAISFVFGFAILLLTLRISRNTGRTLAKFGRTGDLPRMETNTFVHQGMYKYMRHPMHLGLMLFPLAVALLLGSVSFILFIAPAEIILMLIMIRLIEEPEAIKKFGDDYKTYAKYTPSFCFKKQCLKALLKNIQK